MTLRHKIKRIWFRFRYGTWKDRWVRCSNPNCRWLYQLGHFSSREVYLDFLKHYPGVCPCCAPPGPGAPFICGNWVRFDGLNHRKIVGDKRWHRDSGKRLWRMFFNE